MDPWDYISPSSGDIFNNKYDKEFSESYFDVDHENTDGRVLPNQVEHNIPLPIQIKQEVISPDVRGLQKADVPAIKIKTEVVTPTGEIQEVKRRQHRRRSMSVSAIMQHPRVDIMSNMQDQLQNIHLSQKSDLTSKWKPLNESSNSRSLRCISTCSSQSNLHSAAKFVSTAEAIYHLQRDTPKRFHSSSRIQDHRAVHAAANRKRVQQLKSTIAQSPALLSKTRKRPVTVLSQKEIEDQQVEELKKYHIKPIPISKAVLEGICNLPVVQRRPKTQPEPFNLTQVKKKPLPAENKVVFTARPLPKHILEKPIGIPKKVIPPTTVPKTPKFMAHRSHSLELIHKSPETSAPIKIVRRPVQVIERIGEILDQGNTGHSGVPLAKNMLQNCKPQPFSFEQKDKERQTKKMEKIQQFYEEEKRLREFHANPIPANFKKSKMISPKTRVYEKKNDFKKENKENVSEGHIFKARPPMVLFKEPFVPVKKERPVLEACQVQLTTEARAKERDAFNQKIKEKEEQHEMLKKLAEKEKLAEEEEAKAALRAQLVHKAAPVKHYAPIVIHPSEAPLTHPRNPKFGLHRT